MRARVLAAALLAGLAGCAPKPILLMYQPAGEAPAVSLAKPPRVYVERVRDVSGGLAFAGSGGSSYKPEVLRAPADALTAALRDEVERMGLPAAASSAEADAVLTASIASFKAYWDSGGDAAVESELDLEVGASDARGRRTWTEKVAGDGRSLGLGGAMGDAPNRALNAALASGVARAVSAFVARGIPSLAEPVRAPSAEPAPAEIVSDVDELPRATGRRTPRAYAVVIGVEHYREDLPDADDAARDARVMSEYLKRVMGYPADHIALLVDEHAAKGDFEKYLERWLPNRVRRGDEVFVYYSGHGAPDAVKGGSYLVPYDGDPAYLEQTGYSLRRLYARLAKLPARRVVVAMDSCFSGRGGRSVIARGVRPLEDVAADPLPARTVLIAASGPNQVSNTYEEKGHGLFTYFFLKGLKEKGDDLRSAFDYLRPEVARVSRLEYNAEQDPQWSEGK